MLNYGKEKQNTGTENSQGVNMYLRITGTIAVLGIFVFLLSFSVDVWKHTTSAEVNVATAVAHAARCTNNADVTIGLGGLGTGLIPQLSNGVYYPTKATPGGKYFGCMVVACGDTVGRAARYIQQQAQAAGRTITVDIIGHSAGADGSVHLARRLVKMPNVRVRRIVAADATPFAGVVPAGVGHVVNLNSTWNSKAPLRGHSPIQYVNRADRDHFNIDDLIPENLPCLNEQGPCAQGNGEQCRNRCTTTYTEVNGSTPKVTDCYGEGEDKAKKALEALAACIAKEASGSADKPGEPELKKQLCIDNREVEINESGVVATSTANEQGNSVKIPKACEQEMKVILDIRKGEGAQTSATKEDIQACKWKGAVVCSPDAQKNGSFICVKKIDALSQSQNNNPGNSVTQCVLNNRGNQAAITQCLNSQPTAPLPPGTTGLGGSPFGSNTNTSNAFNEQPQQKCPEGYKESTTGGKATCIQDPDKKNASSTAATSKPECLMIANREKISAGEPVVLQWRTANAESVTISNVESTVEKTGRVAVNPTKTTTYELTAKGKGNTSKKCSVTVEVENSSEELTAENQPLIGCFPNLVAKGSVAKIMWSCADGATAIRSEGFNSGGKFKGEAIVRPERNTQYEVECLKEAKVLGKNACSVHVGEPQLEIIASPERVAIGERIRVSWASLFMKNCSVQGPRGFDYNRKQGIVITEPFSAGSVQANIRAANYKIVCETEFGETVSREVSVTRKR